MKKKVWIWILVILLLTVAGCRMYRNYENREKAEEMWRAVSADLADYPALPESYVFTYCVYQKNGVTVLLLRSDGKTITAKRQSNGETAYFLGTDRYVIRDERLVKDGKGLNDVEALLKKEIAGLLSDASVSYSYQRSKFERPLFVSFSDPEYLVVERDLYQSYGETITYSQEESAEIRWAIFRSAEDLVLHLGAYGMPFDGGSFHLRGWGELPQKVLYLIMDYEKMLTQTDEELFEQFYSQTLDMSYEFSDEAEAYDSFGTARKVLYALSIFDMEVQNGGLCQFFVNSSGELAPYIEDAMAEIGAEEHRALFAKFVTENEIDLNNMDSFRVTSVRQYRDQLERYDYGVFDDAYYDLPSIYDYLTKWLRENIDRF